MTLANGDTAIAGCFGGVGLLAVGGYLAFWGLILYGLYQLVFNILPGLAG